MTILQALDRYYDRMAARGEAEAPGWSREKFGWCIVINADGQPVDIVDLHDHGGKKALPTQHEVPAAVKRTAGIAPNFLWDKTAYVLGRTAGDGKRTAQEHAAFIEATLARIGDNADEGLAALRRFLEAWTPDRFDAPPFKPEMLDANVMFQLIDDRDETGRPRFLHQRPAARALAVAPPGNHDDEDNGFCLVTGRRAPIARLHPAIKGVQGAQSSGAPLVSCNSIQSPAFSSYGKDQGFLAPTSQDAAFRYGAALNRLLDRGSTNRVSRPVGDATVVFWADTTDTEVAAVAEAFFAHALTPPEDAAEAVRVGEALEAVARGRPIGEVEPKLAAGTRFYVLGLSPNAARLSVRYWLEDEFETFARRLARHHADCRVEPQPWRTAPSIGYLLARTTALQEKYDNIPPLLAGEVTRAILGGTRYPQSLLAAVLIRLRAGDNAASGWHAAVIRAVLVRQHRRDPQIPEQGETPMSLQRDYDNPGYQLGRLFAVYELAQRSALGRVNATIRDKYFGAASATPASVFPLIVRGGQNHLAKVRKEKPGWAALIEKELEEIHGHLDPALPRSLSLQRQGEFAVGYYHQRAARLGNDGDEAISLADHEGNTTEQGNSDND